MADLPVGAVIRQLRLQRGMTLDQVGAKVGFIRSYIYRVESGKVTPGIENFVRFAEAFEVEPHKLLKTICKIRRQLEAPEPVVVAPEVTA